MWLVHVVRMRLSQEVETFSRLGRVTRAVQISSILKKWWAESEAKIRLVIG